MGGVQCWRLLLQAVVSKKCTPFALIFVLAVPLVETRPLHTAGDDAPGTACHERLCIVLYTLAVPQRERKGGCECRARHDHGCVTGARALLPNSST